MNAIRMSRPGALGRCLTVLLGTLLLPMLAMATPLSGTLGSIGSDTLGGLMIQWGERLTARHPQVRLQVQASGSGTAPPALAEGVTRFGAMSRPMTEAERGEFIARQGYPPVAVPVALDALTLFVHRDNPLDSLSPAQVEALFADTRFCGHAPSIERWGDLGVDAPGWASRGIVRFGRNTASGSHALFKQEALCGGDFRRDVNEVPGSSAVVAAVGRSREAIGYAGLGYPTAMVKVVALRDDRGTPRLPTHDNVVSGRYPLTRPLYLYVNLAPGESLPPLERAFFDLVLSPEGQAVVARQGFVPLPESRLASARRALRLPPLADVTQSSSN
ncbi:phosphate ABC transporter substrate-binding protein, PhoT family [Chromohalobacter israelensis DSM 3043]|uniref:Phosphate ABC transporter substrate-binding protein, PhoT family n=1 Tax=Chromohalobacter israelensis (strain ATCC BAA-138 / DSM 3043 / CIP 106854 / NCIMB 13768 / 1H11) TaxID=290398 RepID=Q1QSE6_CHRI1|nr:phosphate ABC transporter substrate-binding protein, PhoT family [Chromohalobacter salexigens DSM 3043]